MLVDCKPVSCRARPRGLIRKAMCVEFVCSEERMECYGRHQRTPGCGPHAPPGGHAVGRRGPRPPSRPSVPRLLESLQFRLASPTNFFCSSPLFSSSNLNYPLWVFRSQPDMTCSVLGPGAKAWSYWSHWTAILLGERRNHVDEIQHGNLNSDID